MVDNRIVTVPELKHVEDPIKGFHDLQTTSGTIQKLLAGGTPDWVAHPEDFKAYAQEAFAAERERSAVMAARYMMEDQEDLTNRKARMVNAMTTDEFLMKLRKFGIKCFTVYNGLPKTIGLWCLPPKQLQRARYICFMQVPAMYEWSVLALDKRGMPAGEAFRGWRTVLMELIKKEILTEYQAHKIFGRPSGSPVFRRYRESLFDLRNGAQYTKDEIAIGDV
jgi:hypothetical protein